METPEIISIPEAHARLLARLAIGWEPRAFDPPPLVTLRHGERDLSDRVRSVRPIAFGLEVEYGITAGPVALFTEHAAISPLSGIFENGGKLYAPSAHVSTTHVDAGNAEGRAILTTAMWEVDHTEVLLWLAPLPADTRLRSAPGNLLIQWTVPHEGQNQGFRTGHLVLEVDSHRYYLMNFSGSRGPISRTSSWWLGIAVIEGHTFSLRQLARDLNLLRYVLSTPITFDHLRGVDLRGETVAGAGLPMDQTGRAVSPVAEIPVPMQGRPVWAVPFFRKLADATPIDEANAVSVAVHRYQHTMGELDVDTTFSLIAAATAGLIRHLAEQAGLVARSRLVADEDGWARWLDRNEDELQRLATPDSAETLLTRVQAAAEARVEDLARVVLQWLEIDAPDEFFDGLREAQEIAPVGTLYDEDDLENSALRVFGRVQRMRRAFTVLLAHAIGYGGAVSRFNVFASDAVPAVQPFPDPPLNEEDVHRAQQVFQAIAEVPLADIIRWPRFVTPVLPDTPLVARLAAFADTLSGHTGNEVAARLQPLPRRTDRPLTLSFKLLVKRDPRVQTALFSVEVKTEGFRVMGWADEPIEINDEAAFVRFAQELSTSDELRYRVEQVLVLADEIRLGERDR